MFCVRIVALAQLLLALLATPILGCSTDGGGIDTTTGVGNAAAVTGLPSSVLCPSGTYINKLQVTTGADDFYGSFDIVVGLQATCRCMHVTPHNMCPQHPTRCVCMPTRFMQ